MSACLPAVDRLNLMRRFLAMAIVAALALAGCGSSSSTHSASAGTGVLGSELSYFDAGSPFVISLSTNPTAHSVSTGNALVRQFPLAAIGEQLLFSKLSAIGINYQSDIKPLLGNPLSFAIDSANPIGGAAQNFLIAWQTKSAIKLDALIKKLPGLTSHGTYDGAKLYSLGSLNAAVDGATVVLAGSAADLRTGLDHHAHSTGFSAAEYSRLMSGLPQDALLQMFGDLHTVLSAAKAAQARSIPWVGAIRGYGVALSASSSSVGLRFRIDTSGSTLTSAQLPIAPGSAAPSFAGSLPISVGITNPAQAVAFILNAERLTSPAHYARFEQDQAKFRAAHGFDETTFLAELTGDAAVSSDTHTTLFRAALSDPAKAQSEFSTLARQPVQLLNSGSQKLRSLGGGFYQQTKPGHQLTIGISSGKLVLGQASVAALKAFAVAPGVSATGAQGSIAFRVALTALLHLALKHAPSGFEATILSQLGDITGWAQASPGALTGSASLAVK
jgi:hypothetical protein